MSEQSRRPGYSLEFVKTGVADAEKETKPERPLLPETIRGKLEILFFTLLALGGAATALSKIAEVVNEHTAAFNTNTDTALAPPTAQELLEMDEALNMVLKELEIHSAVKDQDASVGPLTQN